MNFSICSSHHRDHRSLSSSGATVSVLQTDIHSFLHKIHCTSYPEVATQEMQESRKIIIDHEPHVRAQSIREEYNSYIRSSRNSSTVSSTSDYMHRDVQTSLPK